MKQKQSSILPSPLFKGWLSCMETCAKACSRFPFHKSSVISLCPKVELPLFQEVLPEVASLIRRGYTELTWTSYGIDDFINEANRLIVQNLAERVFQVRENHSAMLRIVASWQSHPCVGGAFAKEQRYIVDELTVRTLL